MSNIEAVGFDLGAVLFVDDRAEYTDAVAKLGFQTVIAQNENQIVEGVKHELAA